MSQIYRWLSSCEKSGSRTKQFSDVALKPTTAVRPAFPKTTFAWGPAGFMLLKAGPLSVSLSTLLPLVPMCVKDICWVS